jgi:polyisoprenoid-binding protein YceI
MKRAVAVAALALLALPAGAWAQEFHFGADEARTIVKFESDTSLGHLPGTTNKMTGSATIDFKGGTGKTHLIVPVKSMSTGIQGPDNAMRGKTWLDEQQFPTIEFKAEKATLVPPRTWKIDGEFVVKGVGKPLSINADVIQIPPALGAKFGPGDWVKVRTTFSFKLSDYGLKVPAGSALTVNDVWVVTVDIAGTTEKPKGTADAAGGNTDENDPGSMVRAPRVKLPPDVAGKRYTFGKRQILSAASAESVTTVETVVARTNIVGGQLALDADKGTGKVKLSIPVKGLKTGIDKRDKEMLGAAWLDAEKFANIEFESTKISKKNEKTWSVEGNVTIHGVAKPVTVDVTLERIPKEKIEEVKWGETEGLRFETKFKVKLSDHGIKVPEGAVAKVNDEWTLSVMLIALEGE